jgi:mannosyltransferase
VTSIGSRAPGAPLAARLRSLDPAEILAAPWATPVALVGLTALTVVIRSLQLGQNFWIDEGLSVGIAHHHWTSIPHLLRVDGSPPLYYMLLGLWIRLFGDGQATAHTLSLLFAAACVPLAYALGRIAFDRLTGLYCAVLACLDPFLTYYAEETRMYELEALLSLVVALAYLQAIVRGRRAWAPVLAVGLALMLYTHNWAVFLCLGLAVATVWFVRERIRLFAAVAVGVAVLYAPWLPTLVFQLRHTGAPWATAPSFHDLVLAPAGVLSGDGPLMAFALVGSTGLATVLRQRHSRERAAILSLGSAVGVAFVVAWVLSQLSPAWTGRYFAAVVGPLLVLAARGLALAGRLGVAAMVAVVFLWAGYSLKNDKENARQVTAALAPSIQAGELVIATHPEQVPVLRYYLGAGLRWATTMGTVSDSRAFDWTDAVDRLRATRPRPTLDRLIASVRPGSEFVVVTPVFRDYRAWKAKWTKLVWRKSRAWTTLLDADPRLQLVRHVSSDEIALHRNYFKPVQAFVYRRLR